VEDEMSAESQSFRKQWEGRDLSGLAYEMAHGPTSGRYHAAWAELCRQQATWQRDASTATQDSARYMRWSVYAIVVTTGLVALFTFLLWYSPH
jgi:hypothetical protein